MNCQASQIIRQLRLVPHPEGGFYREMFRSARLVQPEDGRPPRPGLTGIYFLLPAGCRSRWHRILSDEIWLHLDGSPLLLHLLDPTLDSPRQLRLSRLSEGGEPLHSIPAGWWQAAEPLGEYSLVSCAVGPGFDFTDFSLMADLPSAAAQLQTAAPGLLHLL